MLARVKEIIERHRQITEQLSAPSIMNDRQKYAELVREHNHTSRVVETYNELLRVEDMIRKDRELLKDDEDEELTSLARSEIRSLEQERESILTALRELLIPRDPFEGRNTIVEIRAGTGGEEAALFARDLFRMYTKYAEKRNWTVELMSSHPTGIGGFKEIIFMVRGKNAYGSLKYESGVHRVQRVPETETGGRIHTSAATVAVLPEAEDVDVEIKDKDLRIDVFRSSGPGGQSVNTTDSAVRITHIPTDIVVTCQDEKSQHKNKTKALKVLRSRLFDKIMKERDEGRAQLRRSQISTGDRSAKIRTYNFLQNRVTDHRINLNLHRLSDVLDGDLDELVEALELEEKKERMMH
ncbi:MAG: peptide chain release factor 1 [Candidatus Glassbacteria bacterium]